MGMSMHIVGYREPDDEWRRMRDVYDACEASGVSVPDVVVAFFNFEAPDVAGIEVDLRAGIAREWRDDSREGFEFDVADLPSSITKVRFFGSW